MKRRVEKKKKKHQPNNNRISTGIYLFLAASTAHRTHLWLHCVWLGLINTYNVARNRASRARVIIGEHFGLHYRTKSLPPRCVRTRVCLSTLLFLCVCVCVTGRGAEKEQETSARRAAPRALYAIMLNHMDRQVLCHNCKGTFDMAWYRGASKHKSAILLAQCQPVSHPSRWCVRGEKDARFHLSHWEM